MVVCDRWLCFENFIEDVEGMDGYKYLLTNGYELDKDISEGKGIYSKSTCRIVPKSINIAQSNIDRHIKISDEELTLEKDGVIYKCNINTSELKALCCDLGFKYEPFRRVIKGKRKQEIYKGYKITIDTVQ